MQGPISIFDDAPDGLELPLTAYVDLKEGAYKAEWDLAEKYRSFVSEIMRLSLLGIAIFPFLIVNIKPPMEIPPWSGRFAGFGIICLAISILFAMRFLFYSSEGLRWYIAGLRYHKSDDPANAERALKKRDSFIRTCRLDKLLAVFFLPLGAVCMAVATISAFIC
jgi:hypothetical protein